MKECVACQNSRKSPHKGQVHVLNHRGTQVDFWGVGQRSKCKVEGWKEAQYQVDRACA